MHLSSLFVENFRNIERKTFAFTKKGTVFVGENGKGKTNILEAIFCLAFTKPFRTDDREIFVEHGKDFARIKGEIVVNEEESETLEIFWERFPKKRTVLKVNGVEVSAKKFLERKNFFAILFSPEDMNLPFVSPSLRRKYLAKTIASFSSEYFSASLSFDAVLKRRNQLLKEIFEKKTRKEEFVFWDTELAKHHAVLQEERKKFFQSVNQGIQQHYASLGGKKEDTLFLQFYPSVPEEDFLELLNKNFEKDCMAGSTQKGSHRDDFAFFLRNFPLEETASRGEVRTALLAFKLCERDILNAMNKHPIFLLDDVFSELDIAHQLHLHTAFSDSQCFLTTTDSHEEAIVPFLKNLEVMTIS